MKYLGLLLLILLPYLAIIYLIYDFTNLYGDLENKVEKIYKFKKVSYH